MAKRDVAALDRFRASARRMPPTRSHRYGVWENMLGTVYAMNSAGEIRYFDYDYTEALAFVGAVEDVRVSRVKTRSYSSDYQRPRVGQLVWFVKDTKEAVR